MEIENLDVDFKKTEPNKSAKFKWDFIFNSKNGTFQIYSNNE